MRSTFQNSVLVWHGLLSQAAHLPKVPSITGPRKLSFFTYEVKEFKRFADNMIRPSVNEIKWTSLLARSRNLIVYISSSFPAHCSLGD